MKRSDIQFWMMAATCLICIVIGAIQQSSLHEEITQLKAKLAYWECTAQREPEQPPAPIAVGPTLIEETAR